MPQAIANKQHSYEQGVLIQDFLKILGKEECLKSREDIEQALNGKTSRIPLFMDFAIDTLIYWENKKSRTNDYEHANQLEAAKKFRDCLEKTIELAQDQKVSDILEHFIYEVEENPQVGLALNTNTITGLVRMHSQMNTAMKDRLEGIRALPKGFLYEYVRELASLYENISGEVFTHHRDKNDEDKYVPRTQGHKFVSRGVSYLNAQAYLKGCSLKYDDIHEMNVCEKARKWLNSYRE